jgi:hypothetical protein
MITSLNNKLLLCAVPAAMLVGAAAVVATMITADEHPGLSAYDTVYTNIAVNRADKTDRQLEVETRQNPLMPSANPSDPTGFAGLADYLDVPDAVADLIIRGELEDIAASALPGNDAAQVAVVELQDEAETEPLADLNDSPFVFTTTVAGPQTIIPDGVEPDGTSIVSSAVVPVATRPETAATNQAQATEVEGTDADDFWNLR